MSSNLRSSSSGDLDGGVGGGEALMAVMAARCLELPSGMIWKSCATVMD